MENPQIKELQEYENNIEGKTFNELYTLFKSVSSYLIDKPGSTIPSDYILKIELIFNDIYKKYFIENESSSNIHLQGKNRFKKITSLSSSLASKVKNKQHTETQFFDNATELGENLHDLAQWISTSSSIYLLLSNSIINV